MLVFILKTPYYKEKKAVKESRQSNYLHGLLLSLPSQDILCYYLLQPPDTHCSSDRQLTQLSLKEYKLVFYKCYQQLLWIVIMVYTGIFTLKEAKANHFINGLE